jgi:hypothetical protein
MKFIACLFVITIHARIPGTFGELEMCMARFAVPFFFAVSGRFLLSGDQVYPVIKVPDIRRKVSSSLKKLLKVTGVVYLVHFVFSFVVNMWSGVSLQEYFTSKFNLRELMNFVLFNSGRVIYDGSYVFDHMWYLFALIYVYGLIYIFAPVLRSWYKALTVILLFFLYFGELLQTFYPIRPFDISITTWYIMRNWLFVGLPFVLIGVIFSDQVCKVRQHGYDQASAFFRRLKVPGIVMVILGNLTSFAEYYAFGSKEVYFGTLFIVIGLLILSESLYIRTYYLYILGKRASSNIYFYHVLVIAVLDISAQRGIIPVIGMLQKPFIVMGICFLLFGLGPLIREGKESNKPLSRTE